MKKITTLITIFNITLFILSAPITLPQENPPTIEVYFSPNGGCTDSIVKELDKAKNTSLSKHTPLLRIGLRRVFSMPIREG